MHNLIVYLSTFAKDTELWMRECHGGDPTIHEVICINNQNLVEGRIITTKKRGSSEAQLLPSDMRDAPERRNLPSLYLETSGVTIGTQVRGQVR